MNAHARVSPLEVFGLRPFVPGLRQMALAIVGDGYLPPSKWGLSSTRQFKLRISLPLWLGRRRADRRVWVYNLPNRNLGPTFFVAGVDTRIRTCRDFRGRQLSYDSHVGTDFATPVGTRVTAAAAGVVCRVQNDMNRGGLKVVIDHGRGVFTSSNHLARALVTPGQRVARGEVVALSGMSSVDGVLFFPWLAPHVHYNVLAGGGPDDPWATDGEAAWWIGGNAPRPHAPGDDDDDVVRPTAFDNGAVERSIGLCKDPRERTRLLAVDDAYERGVELLVSRIYKTALFEGFPPIVVDPRERGPFLSLPFHPDDYDGVAFADVD
ncbi:MAG: hypothetical protein EP329_04265 [Deltaproteobacteria bacterium]|nr:MAG: hypothetical protein EP329_04265 [Deltaproteobacteria bacterium]